METIKTPILTEKRKFPMISHVEFQTGKLDRGDIDVSLKHAITLLPIPPREVAVMLELTEGI